MQQILYFYEVSKVQNFTLAAQNLYVAQSSLSHSIQNMEQEIGVPLFVRKSGRKVHLTSYGQAFLPYAQNILDNMNEGQSIIEKMRNPNSGIVTVAYSYINGYSLVPMVFNRFYEENHYDDIAVRFEINHGKVMIEKELQIGERDLAFSCTPAFEGLCTCAVAKQELFLLIPLGNPLSRAEQLTLEDVKDEPFIGYYQNWNLSNWISRMFEDSGVKQNVVEFVSDWSAQLSYVSMGRGLAITPHLPVDPKLIKVVKLDHPNKFRPVFLHWADNRKLSPAVEYVKQYCLNFFCSNQIVI